MDNIKRHLSYILITVMTAAFVIESFSSAGGSLNGKLKKTDAVSSRSTRKHIR